MKLAQMLSILLSFTLVLGCSPDDSSDSPIPVADPNSPEPPNFPDMDVLTCPSPGELPFATKTKASKSHEDKVADHLIFDVVTNPGDEQIVTGIMTIGPVDSLPIAVDPIAEEFVSLWTKAGDNWKQLGRSKTTEAGDWSISIPAAQQLDEGAHHIFAILEAYGECAEGGVFVLAEGSQAVVSDIDETLTTSDNELITQISERAHDQAMRIDADKLIQLYDQKGYTIAYLTARPFYFRSVTHQWLRDHGFPFGILETADSLVSGDDARDYKGGFINDLKNNVGIDFVRAYGNATSDIDGYELGSIAKAETYIIGENAGVSETQGIFDPSEGIPAGYTEHIAAEVVDYPEAGRISQ